LERLASRLEDIVIDRQNVAGQGESSGSEADVDWRPLQPFLEHDEPVLRAAAARATVALGLDVPPVVATLEKLGHDRDQLVASSANDALHTVAVLAVAAASDVPHPEVAKGAAASVWGEHTSADGRWRYSVVETGQDQMQITCWTEDERLADATVTIEFRRRTPGDQKLIALQLWKIEGKHRWERAWVGRTTDVVGYELRVLGPDGAE
jgi:hypothetical protein